MNKKILVSLCTLAWSVAAVATDVPAIQTNNQPAAGVPALVIPGVPALEVKPAETPSAQTNNQPAAGVPALVVPGIQGPAVQTPNTPPPAPSLAPEIKAPEVKPADTKVPEVPAAQSAVGQAPAVIPNNQPAVSAPAITPQPAPAQTPEVKPAETPAVQTPAAAPAPAVETKAAEVKPAGDVKPVDDATFGELQKLTTDKLVPFAASSKTVGYDALIKGSKELREQLEALEKKAETEKAK